MLCLVSHFDTLLLQGLQLNKQYMPNMSFDLSQSAADMQACLTEELVVSSTWKGVAAMQ